MRSLLFLLALTSYLVVAFPPHILKKYLTGDGGEDMKRMIEQHFLDYADLLDELEVPPSGRKEFPDPKYPFVPLKPGDKRGVCPGVNLLANYGYLPHNGVATVKQLIWGQMEGFGFCYDLAAFLAVQGVQQCGDLRTQKLSIGGPDSRTSRFSTLSDLGLPTEIDLPGDIACGLNNCHNKFEIDMSLTRDDAYFHRPAYDTTVFNSTKWARMKEIADVNTGGIWNNAAITLMRDENFDDCVANNPECLHGVNSMVFNGGQNLVNLICPSAGPDGNVSPATYSDVSTCFGITGTDATNYVLTPGTEKYPTAKYGKWYRANHCLSLVDVAIAAIETTFGVDPPNLPGGNTCGSGTDCYVVDSQIPLNPDVTPNGFICLVYRIASSQIPCKNYFPSPFSKLWVTTALDPIFNTLFGCNQT